MLFVIDLLGNWVAFLLLRV